MTFTAGVETSSPYPKPAWYQWLKDGVPIAGANAMSYTIPVISATHAGKYRHQAGVIGKDASSAEATLTVNADTEPPTVTAGTDSLTLVDVTFSEPVRANTGTFNVSGGVTVSSATQLTPNIVRLKTSMLTPETPYTVTATGVQDNANNPSASSATFTSWKLEAGKVKFERWNNIGGGDNAAITWKLATANDPANDSPALTGAPIYGTCVPPAAPASVTVAVTRSGNNLNITSTPQPLPAGWVLQIAKAVTGSWVTQAGANTPVTVAIDPAAGARYLRAARP